MSDYILAIDQGTTSTRVVALDQNQSVLASHQVPLQQYYPADGWVEHDADAIWQAVLTCLDTVIARTPGKPVAIGVTNQRETTIAFDRTTGTPLHRAIVWQDRRTASTCLIHRETPDLSDTVHKTTGLLLDPYFSATKMAWLLDDPSGPALRAQAEQGSLLFGTIESYLVYRLTGGAAHVSDASNASRTMLMDIHSGRWSEDLLNAFQIPKQTLPRIVDCVGEAGRVQTRLPGAGLPITGLVGDQQAAAIGQGCLAAGSVKSTYGTGCFLLFHTGDRPVLSENRLLTTIAAQIDGVRTYAVEGSIFNAGTVVQWIRDEIGLIDAAKETETVVKSVPDSGGVVMVPAFTGLGAPYWDADARGILTGLKRDTSRAHLVRAALESVVYQTADLMTALAADGATAPSLMRIDGGMSENNWFAQDLANLLGLPVERPVNVETTALGAGLAAGVGVGLWPDLETAAKGWKLDRRFNPEGSDDRRMERLAAWSRAVRQCLAHT